MRFFEGVALGADRVAVGVDYDLSDLALWRQREPLHHGIRALGEPELELVEDVAV